MDAYSGPEIAEELDDMTIVCAVKESSDSILMGADTRVVDSAGIARLMPKMRQLRSEPFVWGVANNMEMGLEYFGEWLEAYSWPPTSWSAFQPEATMALAQINGRGRQLAEAARVPPNVPHVTEVILSGWINGEVQIVEMSHDGSSQRRAGLGISAIGSGGMPFLLAYEAFKEQPLSLLTKVRQCLNAIAMNRADCGPPVDLWRISRQGAPVDKQPKELVRSDGA